MLPFILYFLLNDFNQILIIHIGFARQLTDDDVKINNCKSSTCKLKRKTNAQITMKFTPDKDIKRLITTVNANILDVPFPFIGRF